jgi:hypothetical protein
VAKGGIIRHNPACLGQGLAKGDGALYFGAMAKQVGDIKIVGTVDDICYYRMEGGYYARRKSSLTSKRFWRAKAFSGSRRSCGILGRASSLASRLYRALPKESKSRTLFQQLTGRIKLQFIAGWDEVRIEEWFRGMYFPEARKPSTKNSNTQKHKRRKIKAPSAGFHSSLFGIPLYFTSSKKKKVQPYTTMGTSAVHKTCGKSPPGLKKIRLAVKKEMARWRDANKGEREWSMVNGQ